MNIKPLQRIPLALLALIAISTSAFAQTWNLVWSDEFNGSIGPDWVFETGAGGWGNNELQYYRSENASIESGNLVLTAKHESYGGANYTSVRMKTQGRKSWKYGKIEARIKMPAFAGAWPAFWMLGDSISSVGWPACGELDIMEHINSENTVYGSTHWTGTNGGQADYTNSTSASVTGYHTYTVEWTPTLITWFVDGVQFNQFNIANGVGGTSEFQSNFFILLNFAIGGNWPGSTIDNNAFPAKMYVDWVRVYQQGSSGVPAAQPLFMLVNKNSGKSIDLIGGDTSNGAEINQWSYSYDAPNQRWAFVPTDDGAHFKILSAASGKCLCVDSNSSANSAQIHLWTYNGYAGQQWDLVYDGYGWYRIKNVGSGKVLSVVSFSTADNADIVQYDDNATSNQLFRLHPWGDYYIKASTGKYICVQGGSGANGNNVVQYTKAAQPWFQWHFFNTSEGLERASSLAAMSRAISIKNGSTAEGADAHLWDYLGNDDQQLRIYPLTNSNYKFYFKHTGMSWDIPGGATGNDVPLRQYYSNGNAWQQFKLERIP